MEECLTDIHKILSDNNINFFLAFGTLLGQHRNNDFISHDTDIDFGILSSDFNENMKDYILESDKFNSTFRIIGGVEDSLEYTFHHINGTKVDFFLLYPINKDIKDDYYYCASWFGICDTKKCGYCKWGNHIRGFKQIMFKNKLFNVPKNTEEFLEECYGKDWNIPKQFDYYGGLAGGYKNLIN